MFHIVEDFRRIFDQSNSVQRALPFGNSYDDIKSLVEFVISRFDDPKVILFAYKEKDKGKSLEEILKSTITKAMTY